MRNLSLLVLRCRDMEASRRFYELLGLRFTKHAHGGPEHFAHEDERGIFELYPARAGETDRTALGFIAIDLNAVRVGFEKAGFAPEPIRTTEWGLTFIIRDPDDRRVEIKQTDLDKTD